MLSTEVGPEMFAYVWMRGEDLVCVVHVAPGMMNDTPYGSHSRIYENDSEFN